MFHGSRQVHLHCKYWVRNQQEGQKHRHMNAPSLFTAALPGFASTRRNVARARLFWDLSVPVFCIRTRGFLPCIGILLQPDQGGFSLIDCRRPVRWGGGGVGFGKEPHAKNCGFGRPAGCGSSPLCAFCRRKLLAVIENMNVGKFTSMCGTPSCQGAKGGSALLSSSLFFPFPFLLGHGGTHTRGTVVVCDNE